MLTAIFMVLFGTFGVPLLMKKLMHPNHGRRFNTTSPELHRTPGYRQRRSIYRFE